MPTNPPSHEALDRLLEKRHVVGASFDDDDETVKVFVAKKVDADELDPEDRVPQTYGGYPTDVIDSGLGADADGFTAYLEDGKLTERYRPIEAGVSECHENGTAGTAAVLARVTDPDAADANWHDDVEQGDIVRLSNHHVYVGDGGRLGDSIYQPSPHDGARDTYDTVGELAGYVPLKDHVTVDVAARTTSASDFDDPPLPEDVASPKKGLALWKRGRTTETTGGVIANTGVTTRVSYGSGTITLSECIIASDMSAPGDSGSPVYTNDGELIGLVFAGSDQHTIICPATEIERRLGVDICTERNPL